MVGRYNLGDLVKFQGKIYSIVKVVCFDWFNVEDSVCYGLCELKKVQHEWPYIIVPYQDIEPCSNQELATWRILHGKNGV